MRSRPLVLACLAAAAVAADRVAIGDHETIVLYGDSITEQNLYAAYLETFFISRFPTKDLVVYNFGWSGDSAHGGEARFGRDVVPVKPTLVFVNFGMNDGGYQPPNDGIRAAYLDAQRRLAATIKASGARQVLLTTSPVDPTKRGGDDRYNDALALMGQGVVKLGGELGVPVIDQFTPLRALQAKAQTDHPGFCMIPDSVHPDPVGHLCMAYEILQGVDAPRGVGGIAIDGATATTTGGVVATDVASDASAGASATVTLPFIPFFVSDAARPALALVPFAAEFNALTLKVAGLKPDLAYELDLDGVECAAFTGAKLAEGVDISALDNAPWTLQGRALFDAAWRRWDRHYDAWRKLGFEQGPAAQLPAHAALKDAEAAYVRELSGVLHAMAQPKPVKLALVRSSAVDLSRLRLSPLYPWQGDFDAPLPPEADADAVAWKPATLTDGAIDLLGPFPGATQCAVFARADVTASAACTLRLAMGSDDGLAVYLDGKRVFAKNVGRGLKKGEDSADVPLTAGKHVLLLRVTQGAGGFGLAVQGKVIGEGTVTAE